VSKKTVQNYFCFLPQLRQISSNFDNFWHTDSTEVCVRCTDFPSHLISVNALPC